MDAGGIAGGAKSAALHLTGCRASLLRDAILAVWPGVRRAGRSTAEPDADAGPAAPHGGAALIFSIAKDNSAAYCLRHCLESPDQRGR